MRFLFFPDLIDHPEKLRFVQQESDEIVELFLRQHWIKNLPLILGGLFAFILPALAISLDSFFNTNYFGAIPLEVSLGGLIIWYMLIVAFVLESFLHWYFNVYIVTNKHLVDINFFNLLNRQILEVKLLNVEGVSSRINGFVGSLFHFGSVIAQTAAKDQEITFENVPNPDFVADRIQDLGVHMPSPHIGGNI